MSKGRGLSRDEEDLWRDVARSVTPIRKAARKAASEEPKSSAVQRPQRKSSPAPASPRPAAPGRTSPAPAPLDRRQKQKIARGRQEIDVRLDLHGMTQAQAHDRLLSFLRNAQARGASTALVITGKGARGADGERGVLRRQVPMWLRLSEFSGYVAGFSEAAIGHGGEGALYLKLRKKRD